MYTPRDKEIVKIKQIRETGQETELHILRLVHT